MQHAMLGLKHLASVKHLQSSISILHDIHLRRLLWGGLLTRFNPNLRALELAGQCATEPALMVQRTNALKLLLAKLHRSVRILGYFGRHSKALIVLFDVLRQPSIA